MKEAFYEPVELDDRIRWEWMRIPHFYNAFYVYQYATGISAAAALADRIEQQGPDAYLQFLRAGSSDYPLNLLREAGVDFETGEPIEAAVAAYGEALDRMEEALR